MEPPVWWEDYRFLRSVTWEDLDQKASVLLGTPCLALPSVRVGMNWVLQFKDYSRHRDSVLVPKFLGRCILNALNHRAFPVEVPGADTRMLIAVHQYGLRQDLDAIAHVCRERGWDYIEDSPFGIADNEALGPGSLAKFIALGKVLPVLKGALALVANAPLRAFVIAQRNETSPWSWGLLGLMALAKHNARTSSIAAEMAYELYVRSGGDNRIFRGNIWGALEKFERYSLENRRRLAQLKEQFGTLILTPDMGRLPAVALLTPPGQGIVPQDIFQRFGFDGTLYHVDAARNLLAPRFVKAFVIPLHSKIPQTHFDSFRNALFQMLNPAHVR